MANRDLQIGDKKVTLNHLDGEISLVIPSKIEWDLTNGPLSKLLELLDTQV